MAYGILKCDTVTFTDAGVDKSVSISGLVQNPTFSGNVTVTGTLSGVTVTGTTANFTSGNFTNISGGTHTITSGVFAAGSAASPSITFTGDLNTGIYSPGADQVAISTGGSGRLFVDASGIIGVKRTTQGGVGAFEQIQIGGNAAAGSLTTFFGQNNGSAGGIISNAYYDASNNIVYSQTSANFGISRLYLSDGTLIFSNAAAGVGGTTASLSERLRITSAGLVGVGTSTPAYTLDVVGSTSAARIGKLNILDDSPFVTGANLAAGSSFAIGTQTAHSTIFYTNNSERLRITAAGLVGIGTSAPSTTLHCATNNSSTSVGTSTLTAILQNSNATSGAINGLGFANSGGFYSAAIYTTQAQTGNSGDNLVLNTKSSGGAWNTGVVIDTAGRLGIGTTSPSSNLDVFGSTTSVVRIQGGSGGSDTNRRATLELLASGSKLYKLTASAADGSLQILDDDFGERFRCDSSGRLLVGTSSARSNFFGIGASAAFQVEGSASGAGQQISHIFGEAGTGGPYIVLGKHRSNSVGSTTLVGSNDQLGAVSFTGADGTNFLEGARIQAFVDGTPGTNDMPGRLVFSTTADGASSPTERLRITSAGNVGIGTTSPTSTLHIKGGTANPSAIVHLQPDNNTVSNYITFRSATDTTRGYIEYNYVNDYLAFATTNGSERLRITSAGLVGVGTSSPSARLTVAESAASSDAQIHLRNSAGGAVGGVQGTRINFYNDVGFPDATPSAYIQSRGNDGGVNGESSLRFGVYNGSGTPSIEAMRINAQGRVGIGTTSPARSLHVAGSAVFSDTVDTTIWAQFSTGVGGIGTNNNYPFAFATNGTERARIDSSGRLLVGTSSTSVNTKFILQGGISTNSANMYLARSDAPANGDPLGFVIFSDNNHGDAAYIHCHRDGGTWNTNTSRPTRLVFSTTADGASSPTEALRIINSGRHEIGSAQQGIICGVTSAAGTATAAFVAKHSVTRGNVSATGTDALIIWSNGNVENTNNSYGAISDIKLKENIVDANSQWDDIKALQVRNYNFKEGQTHTQIGLVAQEVELVSPGLVTESPDRDEDGNDLGTVTKSVNYSVLYMKAVKALQEAMERIEQLEQRLTDAGIA